MDIHNLVLNHALETSMLVHVTMKRTGAGAPKYMHGKIESFNSPDAWTLTTVDGWSISFTEDKIDSLKCTKNDLFVCISK